MIKKIPAIDLMNKKVVRLYKGDKKFVKEYGDPIMIAKKLSQFVDLIHIVDLDGAFEGSPKNLDVVQEIIKETGLKVEVGGGFRTYESIEKAYNIGVTYVIVGTAAFDLEFLRKVTQDFTNITVSLDVEKGKLKTKGWLENSNKNLKDAFEVFKQYTKRFIYTDTTKDGTLEGISSYINKFWNDEEVIYAGGITSVEDIKKLEIIGFDGAIIGKALYEGKIKLEDLKGDKYEVKENYSRS
ncbi:MAG: 1-(5-phosphoribosyl)-5-((5-phosphoribosylamino)methylideneamino)imidazole-4-carboxamide isomerase [Defluviitoga tunisiensis]|jgi:phosphoribosylformimino-5-aminoimidazole carboxamide ribotide isomerase|uniref:1-(5-phosphoribosyl)-5-[(5-phosphoribosylamino)methylideneamino] imidazole-4-carboxamide isomerase n=1 Tax=Defluviitoga tunisiensis TaxID=1006576 RepID=A0A0C7NQ31_DEFTU|nr:1-(5-phosphoribosyl)-5-((5-phosphoribosylamino)methylideneamino)imidazole-4-carboxamide isomerase [Defluviitoga tunisiensis]HOP25257.1 1-(5-phosphoribosyl)-5-((5-phosphoribosylamino)methylideneamino)imidazole-4-carboxamide isomerase [Defluviitoga sp.]MDD3601018.1 1-(5-phosphoribosyl)-5-((5-phosphoribosylamino)methylideneamino)imidazole-4-carboxamide isomerase [Defluviitoga tunisiensis]MDY0379936.1 1-(5-phosphoribosyl)-5-((5-phosphoribosylamino)methylideneamino)imidazole-4-carboxamide isomeras